MIFLDVVDVDECAENTYNCDMNAYCINNNTHGGYSCMCNSGFRFAVDGVTCEGQSF